MRWTAGDRGALSGGIYAAEIVEDVGRAQRRCWSCCWGWGSAGGVLILFVLALVGGRDIWFVLIHFSFSR